MIALLIGLQEFVEDTGDAIALLETATVMSSYRAMFKDLSAQALALREKKADWQADNAKRLGLPRRTNDENEGS
jgi:hypothetical protein